MTATLLLENGACFEGVSIGADGDRVGPVVLYTGVVGYQEVLTDPANAGKIVIFTYPLIGNYGVAGKFAESDRLWPAAAIIKEDSRIASNFQAEDSFRNFLAAGKLVTLAGVDTRTLAVTIRDGGEMLGAVSAGGQSKDQLAARIAEYAKAPKRDHIQAASVKDASEVAGGDGPAIAVLDLGVPNGFLAQLAALSCRVTRLPHDTPARDILAMKPDGLVVSSGPEDDEAIPAVVETVKAVLGKVPMLGVAAGHQVIAAAIGGTVSRMKLGHHGVNYPVVPPESFKGHITVQNHSFVVDEDSLSGADQVRVAERNLNDRTVEAMRSDALRLMSTQYNLVGDGFGNPHALVREFVSMAATKKGDQHA